MWLIKFAAWRFCLEIFFKYLLTYQSLKHKRKLGVILYLIKQWCYDVDLFALKSEKKTGTLAINIYLIQFKHIELIWILKHILPPKKILPSNSCFFLNTSLFVCSLFLFLEYYFLCIVSWNFANMLPLLLNFFYINWPYRNYVKSWRVTYINMFAVTNIRDRDTVRIKWHTVCFWFS